MNRKEVKIFFEKKVIPVSIIVGLVSGAKYMIPLVSDQIQRVDARHEVAVEKVNDILRKEELFRAHSLVPLKDADKAFSSAQGYFVKGEHNGKKTIKFAWKSDKDIIISEVPFENARAIKGDRSPTVMFRIDPEGFFKEENRIQADITDNVNENIFRSDEALFSLPEGEYKHFLKQQNWLNIFIIK